MRIYSHVDDRGRVVSIWGAETSVIAPRHDGGVYVRAGGGSQCHLPDDDIPGLISSLQDYMSRRAREMAKATRGETLKAVQEALDDAMEPWK